MGGVNVRGCNKNTKPSKVRRFNEHEVPDRLKQFFLGHNRTSGKKATTKPPVKRSSVNIYPVVVHEKFRSADNFVQNLKLVKNCNKCFKPV